MVITNGGGEHAAPELSDLSVAKNWRLGGEKSRLEFGRDFFYLQSRQSSYFSC